MAKKVLHDKRCTWIQVGDLDLVWRGTGQNKRVVSFDRLWRCDDCNLERRRLYTLYPRVSKGILRYKGRHVPMEERISDEDAIRQEVLETTTDPDIKKAARGK